MRRARLLGAAIVVVAAVSATTVRAQHQRITALGPAYWAAPPEIVIDERCFADVPGDTGCLELEAAINDWATLTPNTAMVITYGGRDAVSTGNDGVNTIEIIDSTGTIPLDPNVTAATIPYFMAGSSQLAFADVYFNAVHRRFTAAPYAVFDSNTSSIRGVARHELGHVLGLTHSTGWGDLMRPTHYPGHRAELGSFEVHFLESVYPSGNPPAGTIQGTVTKSGFGVAGGYVIADCGGALYGAETAPDGTYSIARIPAHAGCAVWVEPYSSDGALTASDYFRTMPFNEFDFLAEDYPTPVPVTSGGTTGGIDFDVDPGTGPDPFEPNDTQADAHVMAVNTPILAHHAVNDSDHFRLNDLTAGIYVIEVYYVGHTVLDLPGVPDFGGVALTVRDANGVIGLNWSKSIVEGHPEAAVTVTLAGDSDLFIETEERNPLAGGPGFFYRLRVVPIPEPALPSIDTGLSAFQPQKVVWDREQFVRINGSGFFPSHDASGPGTLTVTVDGQDATHVMADDCTWPSGCSTVKALFPTSSSPVDPATEPGGRPVTVVVTNPDGSSASKNAALGFGLGAFGYLPRNAGMHFDATTDFGGNPGYFNDYHDFGYSLCFFDYDNDGDEDLYRGTTAMAPRLFRNDGSAFTDVTGSSILPTGDVIRSCAAADYDNDGWTDLLTIGDSNTLLRNLGDGTFEVQVAGISAYPANDAAWGDLDRDGDLDILLATDEDKPLVVMVNDGSGNFSAETTAFTELRNTLRVLLADFNNDGDLDVYASNGRLGCGNPCQDDGQESLFYGSGGLSFTDVTAASGIDEMPDPDSFPPTTPYGLCTNVTVSDFNSDGWNDILCSGNTFLNYARPLFWLNDGDGTFTEQAAAAGLHGLDRESYAITWGDADSDGDIDAYMGANPQYPSFPHRGLDVLLINDGNDPPSFADGAAASGMDESAYIVTSDAVAAADVDGDGDLDFMTTGQFYSDSDYLWVNLTNNPGYDPATAASALDPDPLPTTKWIAVKLEGANTPTYSGASNRDGTGTIVTVATLPAGVQPSEAVCLQQPLPAGTVSTRRESLGGSLGQNSRVMLFHDERDDLLDSGWDCLIGEWLSGHRNALTNVATDSRVVFTEAGNRFDIHRVEPDQGSVSGGEPVFIHGFNIPANVTVRIGAAAATGCSVSEGGKLVSCFTPPSYSPGTVDVSASDGATTLVLANAFTYQGPAGGFLQVFGGRHLRQGGNDVTTDLTHIADYTGDEANGLTADGRSRLVLVAQVLGDGNVQFNLSRPGGGTDGVGCVRNVTGGTCAAGIGVPVTALPDGSGRFLAVAVLEAGEDFVVDPSDEFLREREIVVDASYFPTGGGQLDNQRTLVYRRPVNLAVHGMWGGPGTFGWSILTDPRYTWYRPEYVTTNDAFFGVNYGLVTQYVQEALELYRSERVESEGVIYVGHSMGGLLGKRHEAGDRSAYLRPDNYNLGDFLKVAYWDVPFGGSSLAPFYNSVIATPLRSIMQSNGFTDNGVMTSLDPDGRDIMTFPEAIHSYKTIVRGWGSENRDAALAASNISSPFAQVMHRGLVAIDRTFEKALDCTTGDDFIVCEWSQGGVIDPQHIREYHVDLSNDCYAVHFGSVCHEVCGNTIMDEILNASVSDPMFTTFLPGGAAVVATRPVPTPPPSAPRQTSPSGGNAAPSDIVSSDDGTESALSGEEILLIMDKQGGDAVLSFTAGATRLLRDVLLPLAAGCIAISGTTYIDADILDVPPDLYFYMVDDEPVSGCSSPGGGLAISRIFPASGPVTGDKLVTVLGNNFVQGTTTVTIDGVACYEVEVVNATTLTCRTPAHASGGPYTVEVSDGGSPVQLANAFTFVAFNGGVAITDPPDQAIVQANSLVDITIVGENGFTVDRGTVYGPGFVENGTATSENGVTFTVPIPIDAVGAIAVGGFAYDTIGNRVDAVPITIHVGLPAGVSLNGITARPGSLYLGSAGLSRAIAVWGTYSDGVSRVLTGDPGLSFGTEDAKVAAVSGNVVTGEGAGSTDVLVSYQQFTVKVSTTVGFEPIELSMEANTIHWTGQGNVADVTYDVVKGDVMLLRASGGDFTVATTWCLASATDQLQTSDSASPGSGEAFFYVVRDRVGWTFDTTDLTAGGWPTSKQVGNRSSEIIASASSCP